MKTSNLQNYFNELEIKNVWGVLNFMNKDENKANGHFFRLPKYIFECLNIADITLSEYKFYLWITWTCICSIFAHASIYSFESFRRIYQYRPLLRRSRGSRGRKWFLEVLYRHFAALYPELPGWCCYRFFMAVY